MPLPKSIGDYQLLNVIGQGSFACVVLGEHMVTHQNVAVKVFSKQVMQLTPLWRQTFEIEVSILRKLDHLFIVSLYDVLEDEFNHYIVMEYCSRGSMIDYVNSHGAVSEDQASVILSQIVCALDYMRSVARVAHRDIKLDNILFDSAMNVRFVDFGLSKQYEDQRTIFTTICGSFMYAAPEILTGQCYSVQSEIWSLGIVMFGLLTGHLPFVAQNQQILTEKVLKEHPRFPAKMSPAWISLLSRMLEKSPDKRITLDELKNDPLVKRIVCNRPSSALDNEVVALMREKGYCCEHVESDLASHRLTKEISVYRMLLRSKLCSYSVIPKLSHAAIPASPNPKPWSRTAAFVLRDTRLSPCRNKHRRPVSRLMYVCD